MNIIYRRFLFCAILITVCFSLAAAQIERKPIATIRRVAVLEDSRDFELEVTASGPLVPKTQVVAGPDRLVIDFPNAIPSGDLRNLAVNRGQVNGIRVGLFSTNPPVTRVVLDLKAPQPYHVFASGKAVIVKLNGAGAAALSGKAHLTTVSQVVPGPLPAATLPAPPVSHVEVEFQNGTLTISADRASLAEVLVAVQRHTGADIQIPSGAQQEQVAVSLGRGPARDVMAALLNGASFNFVMTGYDNDPNRLKAVVLTPRGAGVSQSAIAPPPPPAPAEAAVQQPQPVVETNPAMEQGGSDPQPQPPPQ